MRKIDRPIPANWPQAPSPGLDRDAVDRARGAIRDLTHVLPAASVATLAREVISRMARQHRGQRSPAASGAETLAEALIAADEAAALRLVLRQLASGAAVETVYLGDLAGAARVLGRMWDEDRLTSAQVNIAAARIYAIMRGIASRLLPPTWPDGRYAVLATVPGEADALGVSMVADLFRRDGWLIDLKVGRSHDELLDELTQSDFGILGLSASTSEVLPNLTRLVAAVRIAAPHALILVGGRLARTDPGLCRRIDADAVTDDLAEAQGRMAAHLAVMTHFSRAQAEEIEHQ